MAMRPMKKMPRLYLDARGAMFDPLALNSIDARNNLLTQIG
jgi:hypothetical protein